MSSHPMITALGMVLTLLAIAPATAAEHVPVPPIFQGTGGDPTETLRNYPLGVIDELVAFSHHGTAHQKITLPNGHRGWVYDYGYGHATHRFILEFDEAGIVSNVLYRGLGPHDGLSALSLQVTPITEPREEHGGWKWPASN